MKLSDQQLDALKELINIGVGKGASLLNKMLNKPIILNAINVQIIDWHDSVLLAHQTTNASIVHMDFKGQINGRANLIFPNRVERPLRNPNWRSERRLEADRC